MVNPASRQASRTHLRRTPMTLRTLMLGSALALAAASGLAQADDQPATAKPVPYQYGMPMNIDKVLAMNETPTDE